MAKKRRNNQKRRKGGNKTRTTVRSVYTAVQKYPRGSGATVREIHRIISKADKGRSKRTLSSVKLAISRAVKKGSIRAPKGWAGFRGIQLNEEPARGQSTRRDRKPRKGGSVKPHNRRSARRPSHHGKQKRKSSSRRPSKSRTGQKPAAGTSRSLSQSLSSRSRGVQNLKPGAGGGAGSRIRLRKPERGGRGRSQWRRKVRGVGASDSNNSCPADSSDNYNSGQDDEKEASASLWPVNTCVIS